MRESRDPTLAVLALYHFFDFPTYRESREGLRSFLESREIRGSLLLAAEGLNGTLAGPRAGLEDLLEKLRQDFGIEPQSVKWSEASSPPFLRLKVRLKKEIVTLGRPEADPRKVVGTYVKPSDWNRVIQDPEVVLVDTRNTYEVERGKFQGALDPETESFREFPEYVSKNLDPATSPKVAMYCTGGIRCEKASSYLLQQGFQEVFHLEGGILRYLEEVPPEESLWEGECFVFDGRVGIGHGLVETDTDLCHGCRHPLVPEDRSHPDFEEGVSCPRCRSQKSPEDLERSRERQRQMALARARNQEHLGKVLPPLSNSREAPQKTNPADRFPVLYSFRRCPFAIRARLALLASGIPCILREVDLKAKPRAMLELSPKGTVPVLVLPDGTVLEESLEIMLWALERRDPSGWLGPDRARELDQIRALDETFKPRLDAYKYCLEGPEETERLRQEALEVLLDWEADLGLSPEGFSPSGWGLVDAARFPFVRQFAHVDRARFDADPLPRLRAWKEAFEASELYAHTMQKFPLWEGPEDAKVHFLRARSRLSQSA